MRDTGNRDDCSIITLFLFSSSPTYSPLATQLILLSRFHSPHFFSLPPFLFHFLTPFPLTTLERLPSPSPVPRLVSSCLCLGLAASHYFFILLRLIWSSPSSFFSLTRSVPHPLFLISETGQWGPSSPLASLHSSRVPARFFPMAELKTSSLLLGTTPLHPGLSNGLEGAMCLAVYPLQLERSPSLFPFSHRHLAV